MFAFLLLASATLVLVIVLRVTQLYYASFGPLGRVLSWGVVVGSVLALASLALIVLRLYVRPAIATGRDVLANGRRGRKRNA